MTRSKTTLLVNAILMTCCLAGAQTGHVSTTADSARNATGNSPQGSPDVQFQQRDPRYHLTVTSQGSTASPFFGN